MSDLINQVTPLTRGIIWLVKDETNVNNPYYGEIDYLLDGLLTANLKATSNLTSRVIIGTNFNNPLYVMVIKEIKQAEVSSFLTLVKNNLGPENDIIVIDEWDGFEKLKPELKGISSHIRAL